MDGGAMKIKQRHFGQSLVEFALIIPLVLLLVAGFLDLGRAVFYYSSISNMVREGARYAIVDQNPTAGTPYLENIKVINDKAFGIPGVSLTPTDGSCYRTDPKVPANPCRFEGPDLAVTITRMPDVGKTFFENVKVEATYTFIPITPGIKQIFGSLTGIDLKAQSIMRLAAAAR